MIKILIVPNNNQNLNIIRQIISTYSKMKECPIINGLHIEQYMCYKVLKTDNLINIIKESQYFEINTSSSIKEVIQIDNAIYLAANQMREKVVANAHASRQATACQGDCPTRTRNKCIQSGMGGHADAFVNATFEGRVGCEIGCGKRLDTLASKREVHFYKSMADLGTSNPHIDVFRKHISDVHGFCTKDDAQYFIMDNALAAFQPDTETLDFKLGRYTAFSGDSGILKSVIHQKIIDKVTISDRVNFRLEGATRRDSLVERASVAKN